MERTIKEKIIAKLKVAPKGKLFLISDFADLGNYSTIRFTMSELVRDGLLNRIHSGIYQKPNMSAFFEQAIPANPQEIAGIIARKNNWRIAPAKDLALNLLGLDTQVPNSYDFVSNGPTKHIQLEDGRKLNFRHVVQRESSIHSTSSLVIEALKGLGEKNVTDKTLRQVKSKLSPQQLLQLKKDSKNSRVWIKEKISQMEKI
jgi:predicted transcriptional regulator of viral defense system